MLNFSERRLLVSRALWFAASLTLFIWFLYWISYDAVVWNKPLAEAKSINYAGLIISLASLFVAAAIGKIFQVGKPALFFGRAQDKTQIPQALQTQQVKQVQQLQEDNKILPVEEKQKPIVNRDSSTPPKCGFYFGYLHEHQRAEDIPEDCLTCTRVVNCLSPTNDRPATS